MVTITIEYLWKKDNKMSILKRKYMCLITWH